jgi:TolB protein
MNRDGSQSRRLSDGRFSERNPSYSPDGEWIAFISMESGKPEIWVMAADGSQRTQVTDESSTTAQPRWSPDGRWLYYRIGGADNLFMRIHPDGSGREVVLRPEWPEIYLVPNPVDGRILTSGVPPGSQYNQVLVRESLGAPPRNVSNALFIARSDGSRVRQLTDFPEGSYQPRWSPDGESIVFRRGWTNHVGLFSVRPDGSKLVQLTNLDSREPPSPGRHPV